MKVYRQFLNNELLDFFMSGHWEIELACQNMKRKLDKFIDKLEKIFRTLFSLIPKKSKFKKNLNKTKLLFKQDLINNSFFKMVSILLEFMVN